MCFYNIKDGDHLEQLWLINTSFEILDTSFVSKYYNSYKQKASVISLASVFLRNKTSRPKRFITLYLPTGCYRHHSTSRTISAVTNSR